MNFTQTAVMKTILVPVDFSEQSLNALDYAAEMAFYTKSKLILLNVFGNTPPTLDIPIVVPMSELETGFKDDLTKISQRIEQKFGDYIEVKCVVKQGFVVEEINLTAEENNVDLVIMGMQGAGYLMERLMGSITTSVIRKSKKPVLVVSKNMHFKKLKKILLTTDGNRIEKEQAYIPLKKLLNIFRPHLYVVHVIPEMVLNDNYDDLNAFKFDEEWLSHSLSFHHITNDDITKGINQFSQDHDIDMMVMVPHKHDFFERVMHEPQTQKMVFHSIAPLLTLPE